ncbi:hypothetical protein JTE90_028974 [Oedothorax gibbosus]|uniref:Uncharacterized protein n=1 Tax=Oedothorax gibbosus TaxID=931172 RepID=A0AAV6VIN9_9ARAC|nr:hypothetical protein JTE90_028974 [Oedothorax gibbosus]
MYLLFRSIRITKNERNYSQDHQQLFVFSDCLYLLKRHICPRRLPCRSIPWKKVMKTDVVKVLYTEDDGYVGKFYKSLSNMKISTNREEDSASLRSWQQMTTSKKKNPETYKISLKAM